MSTLVSPLKWLQNAAEFLSNSIAFFHFPNASENIDVAKLLWLTRLRWLAVFTFCFLMIPGALFNYLTREALTSYVGIVSILFVFNLISQYTVSSPSQNASRLWVCLHLSFDLFVLTSLLALSGGFESPLLALFLLNVVLGGLLISGNLGWSFLALAHGLLTLLQVQSLFRYQSSLDNKLIGSFVASHILIEIFFIVTRSLGAYIEKQYALQSQSRIALERHDRLRAVGALTAGFSHEFASPLTTAKIRLERLLRSSPSEDLTEAMLAVTACENVVKQMNSAQLDNRDLLYRDIVVSDLVDDVLDSWIEMHPETKLHRELSARTQARIPPVNLAQVLINLLDNAFEANPQAPIEIQTRAEADRFSLSVTDRGPGFDSATMARLGEPFNTNKADGTGLGLYITKLFCESLGGELKIESVDSPRGTRVTLQWPLKREKSYDV